MSTKEGTKKVSLADYFAYLYSIEGWAEFFDGEIFDMAGASIDHATISSNITFCLAKALDNTPCFVLGPGLCIQAEAGRKYVFPDASVFCEEINVSPLDPSATTNPTIIIEVLSPSTSDFDKGGKRDYYMAMPSVQEYLLIEQSEPKVEIFIRQSETDWMFRQISGLDATLELSSLSVPVSIPLSEIYLRVKFPA
jgi:Uma2 family endonuclease